MKDWLSRSEKQALKKARETSFPFPVTGLLLDPYVAREVCWGHVYEHARRDSETSRFSDGHEIHTLSIGASYELGEYVVLVTRNSVYVCIRQPEQQMALMKELHQVPGRALH